MMNSEKDEVINKQNQQIGELTNEIQQLKLKINGLKQEEGVIANLKQKLTETEARITVETEARITVEKTLETVATEGQNILNTIAGQKSALENENLDLKNQYRLQQEALAIQLNRAEN